MKDFNMIMGHAKWNLIACYMISRERSSMREKKGQIVCIHHYYSPISSELPIFQSYICAIEQMIWSTGEELLFSNPLSDKHLSTSYFTDIERK